MAKLGFQGYLSGESFNSPAEIFEDQLRRCQVEYFDFYLLHNVCETAYDFYTNEELGIVDYLLEQKKAGRIRHLGSLRPCTGRHPRKIPQLAGLF